MHSVVCPKCSKVYSIPETSLNSRAKCKSCGEVFTLALAADETFKSPKPVKDASITGSAPAVTPSSSNPGTRTIGRYELKRRLGAGAFGEVWLARDPRLERDIALKLPTVASIETAEAQARFLREPRAAARLQHPNIVPVHDADFADSQFYIAYAFIDGETLKAAADAGRIDIPRAADITRKLADALQHAHDLGIIHRDIKPANVMLDKRGEPQLMDFGLAQMADVTSNLTQQGSLLGTPYYMSPEQAGADVGEIGPASDQYSLGVLLYELLAGRVPFEGPPMVVLYRVRSDEPDPPTTPNPAVPPALSAICLKAMAKHPQDRFASCHDMAAALQEYLLSRAAAIPVQTPGWLAAKPSSEAPAALPIAPAAQAVPWRQFPMRPKRKSIPLWRRPLAWVASGLALVALLALAVSWLSGPSTGSALISLSDQQADVQLYVDGRRIAAADVGRGLLLAPGDHQLEVSGTEIQTVRQTFTIAAGERAVIPVAIPRSRPLPVSQPVEDAPPTASVTPAESTDGPAPPDDSAPPVGDEPAPTAPADASAVVTAPISDPSAPPVLTGPRPGDEWDDNALKMKFCWCPAGTFKMGSPDSDNDATTDEKPQMDVTLSQGFWLGKYEVTQGEWLQVMGTTPWKGQPNVEEGATYPAGYMTWDDAVQFCVKLTELERAASRLTAPTEYSLPTEAEWEYACRAGTGSRYSFGDDAGKLAEYAWCRENTLEIGEEYAHPVGLKKANAWGLHDMHGNVCEWCKDWWGDTLIGGLDPARTDAGKFRVYRGGRSTCSCRSPAAPTATVTNPFSFRTVSVSAWRGLTPDPLYLFRSRLTGAADRPSWPSGEEFPHRRRQAINGSRNLTLGAGGRMGGFCVGQSWQVFSGP